MVCSCSAYCSCECLCGSWDDVPCSCWDFEDLYTDEDDYLEE